ncbi:ATP-dependent helicase [Lecanosticta acicola]|uniref:ATP-dependent helicase n=1 Tax=Lecanosticta acicola TaxID=111012 RepID=A0AAI8YUS7_9PEZI|nr:ATP-dependent helicase [Lecanosticta acicola]
MVREQQGPSRVYSGQHPSPQKREQPREPLANISAKMQSQSPQQRKPTDGDGVKKPADVEFGKASPLRNPLHGIKKSSSNNIFLPKSRPQQSVRPTMAPRIPGYEDDSPPAPKFYMPGQLPPPSSVPGAQHPMAQHHQRSYQPDVMEIPNPANTNLRTVQPPPKPTFTSTGHSGTYKPLKPIGREPSFTAVNRSSRDDEEHFDPDAAIRAESGRFGAEDPYMYVDSGKANENIKNLLESAFDDEEEKGRTRLRRRAKKVEKEGKEAKSFADRLASLSVEDEKEETKNEEEEEEEEDGTVEGLAVKLLPHQVEGVSWMIDKEIGMKKTKGVLPHGGILADDMGLGKTVQSVALILTNPRPAPDAKPEHPKQKLPGKEVGKGTLVVAPLALIKQWESEIKTKVAKSHALKVLVHHGPSRSKRAEDLKKYDVVITTYQTLTSEHAGSNMNVPGGARIGCMGVHWYRLMLDEAHTIKNRNAKSTQACYALNSWYRWCLTGTPMQNNLDELQSLIKFLRIKPYCELPSWKEQITQPMKSGRGGLAMRRLQYFLRAFMKRRTKDILKQEGALNFGGKSDKDGGKKGGMQIVKREVLTVECDLDESEKQFYDRLQERADKRIQDMMDPNHKTDYMGALVLLLRLRQACDHPQLVEKSMNKDKDAMTTGVPASQTARKTSVDDDIDGLTALMGGITVESKVCDVCQVTLSSSEARDGAIRCSECEDALAAVKASKKKSRTKKKEKHGKKPKSRHARNRRVIEDSDDEEGEWISNEPERKVDLGPAGGSDDEDAEGGGETLDTIDSDRSEDADSSIEDSPERARRSKKSHLESDDEDDEEEDQDTEEEDESDSEADLLEGVAPSGKTKQTPSTKIRHLLRILRKEAPEHKTIVFSQFTTMLDLIQPHLQHSNMRYVRYDGSMRPDAREESLNALRNDPKTRVLLCSLKCGSLGLNLTAASRVVIVEPFWNPFVEEQAIDRVHRLNQTVDVKVFRLTIRNTVEERILELQEKKRELAKAAIEGGKGVGKLSMKDILGLFKRDAEHGGHDEDDREMWAKFGGESRLLDGPGHLDGGHSTRDSGEGSRPRAKLHAKPTHWEHDVFGRRW